MANKKNTQNTQYLAEIPQAPIDKYYLALSYELDVLQYKEVLFKTILFDKLPNGQDFTYWPEFIKAKRDARIREITGGVVNKYCWEQKGITSPKAHVKVRNEPGCQAAIRKAIAEDKQILFLNTCAVGEPRLLSAYICFYKEQTKEVLSPIIAKLDELLIDYYKKKICDFMEEDSDKIALGINRACESAKNKISNYLQTQRLYAPNRTATTAGEREVAFSQREISSYFMLAQWEKEGKAFLYCVCNASIGKALRSYVFEHVVSSFMTDPAIGKALKNQVLSDFFKSRYHELILNELPAEGKLCQKVLKYFTRKHVMQRIKDNPYYWKLAQEVEKVTSKMSDRDRKKQNDLYILREAKRKRIAEINASILENIPSEYKDLYPAARNMKRHFILHIGPTNSGKTHDALKAFREAESGAYFGPLRLLAFEVYENTNKEQVSCNMLTGEEEIRVFGATHWACTIEMMSDSAYYDVAVIDEAQMVADRQRGGAWTEAILGLCAEEIHVCAAPEAEEILIRMIKDCGDSYDVVRHERFTKLTLEPKLFSFPRDVKPGDALVVFSRNAVLYYAAELQKRNIPCSVIYGSLPYNVRRDEVERFTSGKTKVVIATDAIGMGLNLPVKRVVFIETQKFDGETVRDLKPAEILQIAGRAGRYGIFENGTFATTRDIELFRKAAKHRIEPIKSARIGFPKRLISIEGQLSEIIESWNKNRTQEGFVKEEITQEKRLCEMLEAFTDDKELIYQLITIPFSDKMGSVKQLWEIAAKRACKGNAVNWEFLESFMKPFNYHSFAYSADRLRQTEEQYAKLDLIYYLYKRLSADVDKEKYCLHIMDEKIKAAQKISMMLEEKKSQKRKIS